MTITKTRRSSPESTKSDVVRRLLPSGSLVEGAETPMTDDQLLEGLRLMMLSRAVDRKATSLQRLGKIGVYSPVTGQEASVVGSCLALDSQKDWLVPQYRELPAYIHHGYSLEKLFAKHMGKGMAARIPDEVKMLPTQVALAAQLPHAVGLAWGLKLQEVGDAVVMTFAGDGASSEGDFHEAMNFAGVLKVPIVFVVQNNHWAISTPSSIQTAARAIADRALGYGFPGATVDGNDLVAVYEAARDAVSRARSGGGPTLIECLTYRLSFHNTTDDPTAYVDPQELAQAWELEPIRRVQSFLERRGKWTQEMQKRWDGEIDVEIEQAIDAASNFPKPTVDDLFENVYANVPPRVKKEWLMARQSAQ